MMDRIFRYKPMEIEVLITELENVSWTMGWITGRLNDEVDNKGCGKSDVALCRLRDISRFFQEKIIDKHIVKKGGGYNGQL